MALHSITRGFSDGLDAGRKDMRGGHSRGSLHQHLEGRPPRAYNVAIDLYAGYYVFVRLAVDSVEPVWLRRVVENPQFDPSREHFREVLVQWYIPCGTSRDLQRLYTGWSTNANFRWKVDQSVPCTNYVLTNNIMASWQPRKNNRETFVAPRKQVQFALDNLLRIVEEEGEQALTIL